MRERHRFRCALVLFGLLLAVAGAFPRSARAHSLKVFASAEGRRITGFAYFPGGGKAREMPVEVRGPQGEKLGEVRTDGEGEFSWTARIRVDHELVVRTPDGHVARFVVRASELPEDLPAPEGTAAEGDPAEESEDRAGGNAPTGGDQLQDVVERAVGRQVRPLREDLHKFQHRERVHEVLGGVGYIFGIMGIVLYFLSRRRTRGDGD